MKLAANIDKIFGKISPPPGAPELYKDPIDGLSRLVVVSIQITLIASAVFSLIYLLWGALDWIGAGSDKETLTKARTRLQNAFVGIIMVVVALALFVLISGNILNIVNLNGGGFQFKLPRF